MRALSYIGAENNTFPPKPDGQTDRRTDISVYRVASLLKILINANSKIIKAIFIEIHYLSTSVCHSEFKGKKIFYTHIV